MELEWSGVSELVGGCLGEYFRVHDEGDFVIGWEGRLQGFHAGRRCNRRYQMERISRSDGR